jgi:predicted dehydrogenase
MRSLNAAIVGCGTIAFAKDGYLPGLAKLDHKLKLIAACDLISERSEKAIADYGGKRHYTHLETLLAESDDIDIIVNLTPIPLHGEINLKILETGKHLVTEKPIANNMQDAYSILRLSKEKDLKIAAAPLDALLPHVQKIRQLVEGGAIGKTCFSRVTSSHAGPADFPFWPTDPSWFYHAGAGALLDMGVYGITQITGILGPAKKVVSFSGITESEREIVGGPARGRKVKVDEDDNTLVMLDFGGSHYSVVDGTYNLVAKKGPGLEIYGRKGTILINQPWWDSTQPLYEVYSLKSQSKPPMWESPDLEQSQESLAYFQEIARASLIEHLADCIIHDQMPVASAEHAVHVLEIMLKAKQSAREGKTLDLQTSF